jgi:hypothetical protein
VGVKSDWKDYIGKIIDLLSWQFGTTYVDMIDLLNKMNPPVEFPPGSGKYWFYNSQSYPMPRPQKPLLGDCSCSTCGEWDYVLEDTGKLDIQFGEWIHYE